MTAKFGTVVQFSPANDVDVALKPARPSKDDCLVIGMTYYNAVSRGAAAMDAVLNEYDGILVRRSLRVFANYADRTGQRDVAKYARMLRDEIKVERGNKTA